MTRPTVVGPSSELLFATGVSHRTVPSLALLERVALSGSRVAQSLGEIASHSAVSEAVLLSTCNRTELYLAVTDRFEAEGIAASTLSREARIPPDALGLQPLWGAEAVRHLFLVAAGLDSMIVGETEIQGQVRRAYKLALLEGVTGPITARLFRSALEAGNRVRRDMAWCRSRPSVASFAVEVAARTLGHLRGCRAVVIGTGENAELTGRALAEQGVRMVFVASRRVERARALARRFGGRAASFERLPVELACADVAFSCIASPGQIVTAEDLAPVVKQRHGRPLLLIDTGMPRNVDPTVSDLPRVELYDIDRLKRDAAGNVRLPADETAHAGRVIDREVARFTAWLASRDTLPAISALREHADTTAQRILEEHEPFFESPSPDDRERVRRVTQAVVNRLLHQPTTNLKRIPSSRESRRYAQALLELFGLDPTAPTSHQARHRSTRYAANS